MKIASRIPSVWAIESKISPHCLLLCHLRRLCFHRCLSVHRGVSATPRPGQTPPGQTPPGRHPPGQCMLGYIPPAQCMLGWDTHTPSLPSACSDTVNKRAVRIPLQCILVQCPFTQYFGHDSVGPRREELNIPTHPFL